MTIKEFANLCGCNPQTIRYYDRMNLLKPVKVDDWTGYRYYDEDQAVSFVKIKNLQTAGFSIDEIKELLDADDDTVYEAFSQKIKEQEERLQKTIELQKSYRSEITMMKIKVESIRKEIKSRMEGYDPSAEFGIDYSTYDQMKDQVDSFFDNMIEQGDYDKLKYVDDSVEESDLLNNPDYEVVYEKHDWSAVKDFYNDFSDLKGHDYQLLFELCSDKSNWTAFANTILGMLLLDNKGREKKLGCKLDSSKDGQNHFWLLEKKENAGK